MSGWSIRSIAVAGSRAPSAPRMVRFSVSSMRKTIAAPLAWAPAHAGCPAGGTADRSTPTDAPWRKMSAACTSAWAMAAPPRGSGSLTSLATTGCTKPSSRIRPGPAPAASRIRALGTKPRSNRCANRSTCAASLPRAAIRGRRWSGQIVSGRIALAVCAPSLSGSWPGDCCSSISFLHESCACLGGWDIAVLPAAARGVFELVGCGRPWDPGRWRRARAGRYHAGPRRWKRAHRLRAGGAR
jgi:hypothetical protein